MRAQKLTRETLRYIDSKERSFPDFRAGDTIEVNQRVIEGDKERIQKFVGDVIAIHRSGSSSTFTVRRIGAHGVAVERIFPYNTPLIDSIKLVHRGQVRRAKLYYVRHRIGKAALIEKQEMTREAAQAEAARAGTNAQSQAAE